MIGESCVWLGSKEIWVFGSFRPFFKIFEIFEKFWKTVRMNQKLRFLCFQGIHYSLPSFWAKLGYSWIKIDHIADSLLKLPIKIGVHLINVELSQLLTLIFRIIMIFIILNSSKGWMVIHRAGLLETFKHLRYFGSFQMCTRYSYNIENSTQHL